MKLKYIILPVLFITILSVFSITATVYEGKNPFNLISTEISPGQIIDGKLNLSLKDEPNNMITAEVGYNYFKMILSKFLDAQPDPVAYSCSPENCLPFYKEATSLSQIDLTVGENSTALIGLNLNKNLCPAVGWDEIDISDLNFDITGMSLAGDYPTPSMDIGNDRTKEWEYLQPSPDFGKLVPNYKITSTSQNKTLIAGIEYCERIKFVPSLKFRAFANATSDYNLTLKIYSANPESEWQTQDDWSCITLPNQECEINMSNDALQDYYVCVTTDCTEDICGDTAGCCGQIKAYSGTGNAGKGLIFNGLPPATVAAGDFPIDVKYATYQTLKNTISIKNDPNYQNILASAQAYLSNSSCDANATYCVIPISFSSLSNGKIRLDKLNLKIETNSYHCSEPYPIITFSTITEDKAKITMNTTELSILPLNITSSKYGTTVVTIRIGSYSIFDTFETAKVPIVTGVSPLFVAAGASTNFTVRASSPKNVSIIAYQWNFGDGVTGSSETATIMHRYSSIGNFTLTVTAIDKDGLAGTGTFKITTAEPRSIVNQTLIAKRLLLTKFTPQFSAIPPWYKPLFAEKYDITTLASKLSGYETEFKTATTNELVALKLKLDALEIPEKIEDKLVIGESVPAFTADKINLEYLQRAGAGEYDADNADKLKDLIKNWQYNVGIKISGTVKKVVTDMGGEDVATIMAIKLTPTETTEASGGFYLIIQLPQGVAFDKTKFDASYSQQNLNGAIGIEVPELSESKTISLAMPGNQNINLVEIYASPTFETLMAAIPAETQCGNGKCDTGENSENCPSDCPPIFKAIGWIVFIVLASAAGIFFIWKVYAVIYEKNQEKKIFKSKNDVVSITVFIVNAKVRGMPENEIREKLEKAGWNNEQIAFAFMKVERKKREIEKKIREAKKLIEHPQQPAAQPKI